MKTAIGLLSAIALLLAAQIYWQHADSKKILAALAASASPAKWEYANLHLWNLERTSDLDFKEEYKVMVYHNGAHQDTVAFSLDSVMNTLGGEGWEIVLSNGNDYLLKRAPRDGGNFVLAVEPVPRK